MDIYTIICNDSTVSERVLRARRANSSQFVKECKKLERAFQVVEYIRETHYSFVTRVKEGNRYYCVRCSQRLQRDCYAYLVVVKTTGSRRNYLSKFSYCKDCVLQADEGAAEKFTEILVNKFLALPCKGKCEVLHLTRGL